jgi:hypothetical protein
MLLTLAGWIDEKFCCWAVAKLVRHQALDLAFEGSSPSRPAISSGTRRSTAKPQGEDLKVSDWDGVATARYQHRVERIATGQRVREGQSVMVCGSAAG